MNAAQVDATTVHGSTVALRYHLVVGALLVLSAILAITSLRQDSVTFDETSHLTAGLSYWKTGDYRLTPDHPPLAQLWAALPLLLMDHGWSTDLPGWRESDFWFVGRSWFSRAPNVHELLCVSRMMIVLLLLVTCWLIYAIAKSLWGRAGGLIALTLAALSPTLLAHGRLVTTDLPATLLFLLTIYSYARLVDRLTIVRCIVATLSLAALSLTKFSWPVILPSLLIMACVAVVRNRKAKSDSDAPSHRANNKTHCWPSTMQRRGIVVVGVAIFSCMVVWLTIWSIFSWRYSPYVTKAEVVSQINEPPSSTVSRVTDEKAWRDVLSNEHGQPLRSGTASFVRWARDGRWLPEAYLFGLAYTDKTTRQREAYFLGEISDTGWLSYFPVAFLIKTPIATIFLIVLGGVACIKHVSVRAWSPLAAGLVVFFVVYVLAALASRINIGHRHIVAIYPPMFILAGACSHWMTHRGGRVILGSLMIWLAGANAWIYPHYLSYFNEVIGGPSQGYKYLADSNVDWGQDLRRLADYLQQESHRGDKIKLAWFGMVDPSVYDVDGDMLPSSAPFAEPAQLVGGTYIISVTQLLGVYVPQARDIFWDDPRNRDMFLQMDSLFASVQATTERELSPTQKRQLLHNWWYLRSCLLLNHLQKREPDDRIGYSLFVFRLSDDEVRRLTRL